MASVIRPIPGRDLEDGSITHRTILRTRGCRAQDHAELIELVLGEMEFAVGHPQPSHERTQVKDGRLMSSAIVRCSSSLMTISGLPSSAIGFHTTGGHSKP